jgi:hypothetical protein
VNESAGDQVADMLGTHLDLSEELLDSPEDVSPDDIAVDEAPVARAREGLPRSFRMRHDAHYVDELMSRTAETPGRERDTAPAPAATPTPAVELIADRLESIVAHSHAGRPHGVSFIEQSVHIELMRVARLARAAAILQQRELPVRESVFAHEIADRVTRAAAPVARMAGMEFDVSVDDRLFEIALEPAAAIQGIVGTVDAVVELLLASARRHSSTRQAAGRIAISLQSVKVRPALIVDVFCPTLAVTAARIDRFFRNAAEDYRSAPAVGLLLAAAAHTVRAHGGRADIKQHAAGVTITYVYPHTA